MHVTNPVPFSIEQLEALMQWAEQQAWGLGVTIATDHQEIEEVAEVWRQDRQSPCYYVVRHASGLIEIASIYTLPEWTYDLPTALAHIDGMESRAISSSQARQPHSPVPPAGSAVIAKPPDTEAPKD